MSDETATVATSPEEDTAEAMSIVRRNMLWSAGAGLLPMPLIEWVAITAVELKLIKGLADHYGVPFRNDLAKSSIISLIGSLGGVSLGQIIAGTSLRFVPFIGPAIAIAALPAVSAALTYAIGKVFIAHFEAGGTLLDFNAAKVRDYFRQEYANGVREAANMKQSAKSGKAAMAT